MLQLLKFLVSASLLSLLAVNANATDIQNGGFETGTLAGWTSTGQTSITNAGFDFRTNNALSTVGVGTHSAMVGDAKAFGYSGDEYSSISQNWTKTSSFDHLYFDWATVALVPTDGPPHTKLDTAWFQINVKNGGTTLFNQEYYTGNVGSIVDGWIEGAVSTSSNNGPGIWYYRPWEQFDLSLSGIADGANLSITLTTRDCDLSGHSSYAYLDGFGSVPQPTDRNPVPEPSTMLLLGAGMLGMAFYGKRRTNKQA